MAKDNQSHHYQKFQNNKADWAVGYWFRVCPWAQGLGLKASDFESHPQADNIVTLLLIRQSLWDAMTTREQACWGGYWGIVYRKHFPLNKKFWNKFTRITQAIDNRQHNQQQVRQRIQQLKNKDHNSEAKGSDLSQGTYTKGNNRGAVKKLIA
jgi:hypothetical protein